MFSQNTNLEKYDTHLSYLHEKLILPILNHKNLGVISFDWDKSPLREPGDALVRCDYDTYKTIKESSVKATHRNDSIVYTFSEQNHVAEPVDKIIKTLGKEIDSDILGLSNNIVCYKDYEEHEGYMGWHTNYDYPGDRWYFVYNSDNNKSFFRYINLKSLL